MQNEKLQSKIQNLLGSNPKRSGPVQLTNSILNFELQFCFFNFKL